VKYIEQLQEIVNKYIKAGGPWPAEKRAIAAWAVQTDLWKPHPSKLISQCAEEIGEAMRQEHFLDKQGRSVRAKHAARVKDKNGKQITLWGDMRTEPPKFMAISFQQRRQLILGECHQLKIDVDSYNQNRNSGEPIQVIFNFTTDLAEMDGGEDQALTA